jgi:hypothetical protein
MGDDQHYSVCGGGARTTKKYVRTCFTAISRAKL